MKKLVVLSICILLCACTNVGSVEQQLDDVFKNEFIASNRANNYTEYIEYYIPSDVYETDADKISYVFNTDNCKFIMNINIANIVNKEYNQDKQLTDEGFFDQDNIIYSKTGELKNLANETLAYTFEVFDYDEKCIICLVSDETKLYGTCDKEKIGLLSTKMIQMATNCDVKNDMVIANYSTKDVIDYEKSTVNLFKQTYPQDGRVEDMMTDAGKSVSE